VFTACGIKLPAGDQDEVELKFHFTLVTSRQHRRCIIPQAVNTGGRNYRPKHVELIEINNKIIVVGSIWLFVLLYQRCTVTQT